MAFKLITFIILYNYTLCIKSQLPFNHSKDELIDLFEIDSNAYIFDGNTLSFQLDSLPSGTAEFKMKNDNCYKYKFIFACKKCFDCNIFTLTEDYYSPWSKFNDSVYYYEGGSIGSRKSTGEKKKLLIPKMTLKYVTDTNSCLEASFSGQYMTKSRYNQLVNKPKIKFKKRNFKGTWKIEPNNEYPTDIDTIKINKKYGTIIFKDQTIYDIYIQWVSSNTCQFWYYNEKTDSDELYLTCEILKYSRNKLNVKFYSDCEKYYQSFKKVN